MPQGSGSCPESECFPGAPFEFRLFLDRPSGGHDLAPIAVARNLSLLDSLGKCC